MATNTKIAIIGLGYVGLPLAIEFSKYYKTIGFDHLKRRINKLKNYEDINKQFNKLDLKKSKIEFTNQSKDLIKANIFIVCVPTPVNKRKNPNLKYLIDASKLVSKNLKNKDIVIYESTVYPGTTEDVCIPILEKISKLKCNKDFFIGYSPERINPGDKEHTLTKIKKIVSASNKNTLNKIYNLYSKIVKAGVYKAENIKTAEAAKIIENTQRDINIAFMNELSIIFEKMSLNSKEVLKAASTKWNFLNFKPGLVGGHCIGVDPYYLAYASKKIGYKSKFILSGRSMNENSYMRVVNQVQTHIAKINNNKKLNCLVLGFTFKENCPDIRNSQAVRIIDKLKLNKRLKLSIYDPEVYKNDLVNEYKLMFNNLSLDKKKYDILLILVPHKKFTKWTIKDINTKIKKNSLIVDIHNIIEYKKITKKVEYFSF
tara:strand:+ start:304 stop:1590 length:1287 start_codon:yes stop_codon:yes gene_type:complete